VLLAPNFSEQIAVDCDMKILKWTTNAGYLHSDATICGSSQRHYATVTKRHDASCDCYLKFRLCPFGEVLMSILATCVSSWNRMFKECGMEIEMRVLGGPAY
jgi:hypothetical protein